MSIPVIWVKLWAVEIYAFWWENGLFRKIGVIFCPPTVRKLKRDR